MIGSCIQRGSTVYVKDSKGYNLSTINAGNGDLVGYTGSTVSIERGSYIYLYDAKGHHLGQMLA